MLCPNCGASVAEGKRFCADCGTSLEELTRLARPVAKNVAALSADHDGPEEVIFVARPTLMFVKAGYLLAALGGIALAFLIAWFLPQVPLYVWLPLSLAVLLIPAYHHFKRNLVRYTLTETKIEIDEGFIARTTRNIPLTKVQDVTVTSGLAGKSSSTTSATRATTPTCLCGN
jgi:hypothetical protein